MNFRSTLVTLLAIATAFLPLRIAHATAPEDAVDISSLIASQGFYNLYWDEHLGKLWLEVDRLDEPFIYVSSLATGLGSNPVGLDRGQLGDSRLVRFRRVGRRLFLIQENVKYRSVSENDAERQAVADSFAESIIWSGELHQTNKGIPVVDMTTFLIRDAHDCIRTLAGAGQGSYSLDIDRSFVYAERCKAFPRNCEFEATLTLASSNPGRLASQAAADGAAITLRQHHSFVALPDGGYRPRLWDPRIGSFSVDFKDYSAPINESGNRAFLTRHRLEKVNPNAPTSPVKQPIIYYVDSGVPQPVRDALVEGASWWKSAFEAAGFQDAFDVRVLPKDVDPMDVRFNVIQWVHRVTRGWSYGQSIVDPRTGEIIKGHVRLGSLRVRQDHRLFDGLRPDTQSIASASFSQCWSAEFASPAAMLPLIDDASNERIALARIRQLSAHEVGHTLGFAHNFAASTYGDRASVMDYPAPRIKINGGKLDFSDAYGVGVGSWDYFAVKAAYSQFNSDDEAQEISKLIQSASRDGLLYLTDADARPAGAAHPLANLWDNGEDPIAELEHALEVRRIALANFTSAAIPAGAAHADLEQVFAPVYLHHRYQVEAAAKMLGGYYYEYSVREDDSSRAQPSTPTALVREVSAEDQARGLQALLRTLTPEVLEIPAHIRELLPPRTAATPDDLERFSSKSAPLFDPAAAMTIAADLTLQQILQPQRATRLAQSKHPECHLDTVLRKLTESLIPGGSNEWSVTQEIVTSVYIARLIDLSSSETHDVVRAIVDDHLSRLAETLTIQVRLATVDTRATCQYLARQIARHLNRQFEDTKMPAAPSAPPGSPIGEQAR